MAVDCEFVNVFATPLTFGFHFGLVSLASAWTAGAVHLAVAARHPPRVPQAPTATTARRSSCTPSSEQFTTQST